MLANVVDVIRKRLFNSTQEPKGPSQLEILKELKNSNPLEFITFGSTNLMQKYGDFIRLNKKHYMVADPNAFKYILKTNVNNFSKNNKSYARLKLIFGDGLITNEGPSWQLHRTILQPIFNRERLEQYSKVMVNSTLELLTKWTVSTPLLIDISKEMGELTLKIAFRVFANYDPSPQDLQTVITLFQRGNSHVSHFPILKPWVPTIKNLLFFSALRKVNRLLKIIIDKRSTSKQQFEDVIGLLLNAPTSHQVTFNESEILNECITLLITGYETAGCAIAWAQYLLTKHPEYQILMEEELETVLNGRLPTIEDCNQLPITKAIFLETLRLYPSIWCLPRIALQNDEVCGYSIPGGSTLILNIYALHRNPSYWENPETFYPARFLNDDESKRHLFSYLPFSIGPHACIGSTFGITEGILILATIAQRFRFEILNKEKEHKAEPYTSLKIPSSLKMRPIKLGVRSNKAIS